MLTHYEQIVKHLGPGLTSLLADIKGDSYEEFLTNSEIQKYLNTDDVSLSSYAMTTSTMQMFYHLFLMKRHGEKIFVLEPDLALMLANTDIKGVTGDMLKTPYREQMFVIPDNIDFVSLFDPRTGSHKVSDIYVSFDGIELRLLVVGAANENSVNVLDDVYAYFRYQIDGTDLKQQIRTQIEQHSKNMMITLSGGHHNIDKAEKIFNFILNILLYTTSKDADLVPESWKDIEPRLAKMGAREGTRYKARLKASGRYLKIRVGAKTKLTKDVRELYRSGTTLSKKTLVIGHWMHYHIGAGRADTVLKWRMPFWRGVGELSNLIHKVGL